MKAKFRYRPNCKCVVCGRTFWERPARIRDGRGKYCSRKCVGKNFGACGWWEGKKRSPEMIKKMCKTREKRHPMLKYGSLHDWVRRRRGTPSVCEHCGTTTAKKYCWANKKRISHNTDKYFKKIANDWLRLCVSCHNIYDSKKNLLHR